MVPQCKLAPIWVAASRREIAPMASLISGRHPPVPMAGHGAGGGRALVPADVPGEMNAIARQTAWDPVTVSGIIRPSLPFNSSTRSPPAPCRSVLGAAEPGGTIDRPGAAASRTNAAGMPLGNVTRLRCGGCPACAFYARNERWCGQLVLAFLGLHELCGKAVRITCFRGGHI